MDNDDNIKTRKEVKKLNNLISTKELAKKLGVTEKTIYRYRKVGMPYKRISERTVRYDLEEVMKWIENNKG